MTLFSNANVVNVLILKNLLMLILSLSYFILQYHEDKTQIKDAMKIGKVIYWYLNSECSDPVQAPNIMNTFFQISLASSWTFEDFKASVAGIDSLKGISEINLKVTSPLLCFYYLIFSEWLVVKDVFCYQQTSYYLLLGHMYFCS